jgi:hypothetical protein
MFSQRHRDITSSVFCLMTGAVFSSGSLKYGGLHVGFPNATFFPFAGGIVLMLLSLILLVSRFPRNAEIKKDSEFFPRQDSWKRILITVCVLFLYNLSLSYLGFMISNLLFMIVLLRSIEPERWRTVFLASVLTAVASHILFVTLLQVEMPKGFFGV